MHSSATICFYDSLSRTLLWFLWTSHVFLSTWTSHVLLSTRTSHVFMLTSSLRSRLPGLPADGSRRPKCRYQLFDFLVYIPPPCALGFHPATYHAHACFPLRTLLCSLRYISCWLRCILYLLYPVYPLVYSCLLYTLVVLMKRVCDLANICLFCAIISVLARARRPVSCVQREPGAVH